MANTGGVWSVCGKRKVGFCVFFFNDTATTEIYTLSLHDALPIFLLETGETIGETKKMLSQYGESSSDKISYKIPYPVAMDSLIKQSGEASKEKMDSLIKNQIPNFDEQPEDYKKQIYDRVKGYFMSKEFSAETFEMYALPGTPSSILVDRDRKSTRLNSSHW